MRISIAAEQRVSAEHARSLLAYDPSSGEFVWRRGLIPAGCLRQGYRVIGINRRQYLAHRLAWLYVTGEWPRLLIDHINGVKDDNRFQNLRQATTSQNKVNTFVFKPGRSGFRGVRFKDGRWQARVQTRRQRIVIGSFETADEAHRAYAAKARELFGQFSRAE